jgi:hypothetical protein
MKNFAGREVAVDGWMDIITTYFLSTSDHHQEEGSDVKPEPD